MCDHAAAIVTKTNVHWCETPSHTDMIKKLGLRDDTESPDFVRVQIVPPDLDYRLPCERWLFQLDQDFRPDWYNREEVESAVRAKLPEWRTRSVVMPGERREKHDGGLIVACYGEIGRVIGNGRVDVVVDNGRVGRVAVNGRVGRVAVNGRVDWVSDNGRVTSYCDSGCSAKLADKGHIIDMRGDRPRIIVAQ